MPTATVDQLVGRTLEGRYRILDRIARGGMSTVYAAVDERLDRLVAVKVMSSALSADPAFSDRFAREARAAARLGHVNAVSVYDQGQETDATGHHVFLVMELVQGRTLRDLIRERGGRFTAAEAVSIMEPVLAALAAAHRAGLVHRDIKPENILLSNAGVVKVADFGLARALDADATSTRTGLMMGTVAYCAPEQIVRGHADHSTDVYSAGIVLFELLTGRPPYIGDSAMTVAYQHVHSRVPAPGSRVPGVPVELDEVVVAATDSDPSGRPPDAAALLAELADVREQLRLPVMPVPARAAQQPTGFARPPLGSPVRHATAPTQTVATGRYDTTAGTQAIPRGWDVRHDTAVVDARPPAVARGKAAKQPQRPKSARARRRRRKLVVLLVVLLVGALSVTGGVYASRWLREWNSHVPNLLHHSVGAAESALVRQHYHVGHIRQQFSDSEPKGNVIGTEPTAGTRLQQGRDVDLTVSLGQELFQVPDVAGEPLTAAEATLGERDLKFDPTPTYRSSTTVGKGRVIATTPAGGARIPAGRAVSIVVSSGLPILAVPTIGAHTSFDQAQATLQQAKFVVRSTEAYSNSVPAGNVIGVDPSGRARQGSTITVTVSKGPEFVTVPKFGFLSNFDDAQSALEALGLHVDRHVVYGLGVANRVVGQTPKAGTRVHVGDTVIVNVV